MKLLRPLFVLGAMLCVLPAASARAAQPDPEEMRVLVVSDQPSLELQVEGPVQLLGPDGALLAEGDHLPAVTVRAEKRGFSFGSQRYDPDRLLIVPQSEAGIRLNGVRLRGTLELIRQKGLQIQAVNHVPLESYLRGVLSKEAPDYWPEEALKAIAIAARTYAVHRRYLKANEAYDVSSNVMSQEYGGKSSEKHATDAAVSATAGQVLLFGETVFPTFYHSTCGEVTENGQIMGSAYNIPPLRGGSACYGEASPFHRWKRRFTPEDVNWVLHKSRFGKVGAVKAIRVDARTPLGRVEKVTIIGSTRELALSGYDFRALFGFDKLRSLEFRVVPSGRDFIIDGQGWGHGVGMCQWGAAELARRGFAAKDILAHYYPETRLAAVEELKRRNVKVIGGT